MLILNQYTSMSSLVEELQRDALNPRVSVTELLRKAKVIAAKLALSEFSAWVEKELRGYIQRDDVPFYRVVTGQPKAFNPYQGWQPVVVQSTEKFEMIAKSPIGQSIGELEHLANGDSDDFEVPYPPEIQSQLMRAIGRPLQVTLFVGKTEIIGILESVKNILLDWSLKLEQSGIAGDGMSFSKEDRNRASEPSVVYKIGRIDNFTGAMGPISDQASVSAQSTNGGDIAAIRNLMQQIEKYESELSLNDEQISELRTVIENIKSEAREAKPTMSRIRSLLLSVKSMMEGTAGSLIAQGIVVEIGKHLR
jgi:hypothetical protein